MPTVHDEGLCIRQWDWSETSQTAAVFCRELGLVRGLAKGSKRPRHPYSGGLEILTRGRVGVIVRPSSDLALLTEWDLVQTFPALRSSLAVHNAGLYVADLLAQSIRDHDPHVALYDATLESLGLMRTAADVGPAMLRFQWSVLVETGYKPELRMDVRTGEGLKDSAAYAFSPSLGGFTAEGVESAEGSADPGRTWRVRGTTVDLLRRVEREGLAGLVEASAGDRRDAFARLGEPGHPRQTQESLDRANRLLASYLRYVLGVEPPTMTGVFGAKLSR